MSKFTLFLLFGVILLTGFQTFSQTSLVSPEPIDTYGHEVSWKTERFSLDNSAFFLKKYPEKVGYIAFFIGDNENFQKAKRRAERAKRYLVDFWKIDSTRIVIMCGGSLNSSRTSIWIRDKDAPKPDFRPFTGCK